MKVVILGFGGRGKLYSVLGSMLKEPFEVVGVCDTSISKLEAAKEQLKLSVDKLFSSADELFSQGKLGDYVFICTQDKEHFEHTMKALDCGYDILLEKPIATNIHDCLMIEKKAKLLNRKIAVCHVLRYSAYYSKIKEVMDSGVLGQIISIEQVENVAFWHQAHSFVRGDWGNEAKSNPMILAKCCHDLDIAVYLADSQCENVSSMGKLNFFKKENAPRGCAKRCMDGCKVKENCPYDAEKIYLKPLKGKTKQAIKSLWPQSRLVSDGIVTVEKVKEAIKIGQFGRCVFHCENDVVDYQVTQMIFKNGIHSILTMTAFSETCFRETRIRGSLGELVCDMEKGKMVQNIFGKRMKHLRLGRKFDSHGNGDASMIAQLCEGNLTTDITKSIESHLIGFCAEDSRKNGGMPINIAEVRKNIEL